MLINNLWFKKLRNIFLGIFIVFFAQLTLPILFELQINKKFFLLVIAIIVYFSIVDLKDSRKLARNAFFLIFTFGTVIALIRPVQYALDEESHLENAIGISDSLIFEYTDEDLKDYQSVFLHDGIRNQANYLGDEYWYSVEHKESTIAGKIKSFDNPAFLPGMIGFNLGRLLSDKVYISYYLGRIFHVLAYALVVFLAIKISKVYKHVIYLLGTLPSAIYVVSGYHYDYLYYGASLLIVAKLTNILAQKEQIDWKYILKFQTITLFFIFSKFPFVLVGTLLPTLPTSYFKNKQTKLLSAIAFIPVFLLALIYAGILNLFNFQESVTGNSPGLLYFIRHPLPILRTILDAPVVVIDNFIRRPLQYVSHESGLLMNTIIVVVFFLFFLISLMVSIKIPKLFKYYTLLLMLGIAFLMIYAITGDTRAYNLGDILVGGVQGRYYYFILTLIPMFLSEWLKKYIIVSPISEDDELRFTTLIQYLMAFLLIFTVSVGFYTQI